MNPILKIFHEGHDSILEGLGSVLRSLRVDLGFKPVLALCKPMGLRGALKFEARPKKNYPRPVSSLELTLTNSINKKLDSSGAPTSLPGVCLHLGDRTLRRTIAATRLVRRWVQSRGSLQLVTANKSIALFLRRGM